MTNERSTPQKETNTLSGTDEQPAAERFLRALHEHDVEYLFANYGTDHTPLIEAAATIRADNDVSMPESVICPHEAVALSAAHGFAAVTGKPQAVLVHVDVGTQNLGGAVHNAHRAEVPVMICAGLAPVSDRDAPGARDHSVHYVQDVFDQPDIVKEYCRWHGEYRTPADPEALVVRGLTRARSHPAGPVYLTASREALEASIIPQKDIARSVTTESSPPVDPTHLTQLIDLLESADAPLVVTSKIGKPPEEERVQALVEFAETIGAGVVEHRPFTLSFPRDHELHVGFDTNSQFDEADLVILADTDIPWIPAKGNPPADVPIIQIDRDPTKRFYPHWDFPVDHRIAADPAETLAVLASEFDRADGKGSRKIWQSVSRRRQENHETIVEQHRDENRLTPHVLSDAINGIIDESTILMLEAVSNNPIALNYLKLTEPGSFHFKGGSALGWAPGAAVGAKMASPDSNVVALVGDGAYVFSNPVAAAWLTQAQDAPTLTIVYNNRGWEAVRAATGAQHPDGAAIQDDVPEGHFNPSFDLSIPAQIADAYTARVTDVDDLEDELSTAMTTVEEGTAAVVDVAIETVGGW